MERRYNKKQIEEMLLDSDFSDDESSDNHDCNLFMFFYLCETACLPVYQFYGVRMK